MLSNMLYILFSRYGLHETKKNQHVESGRPSKGLTQVCKDRPSAEFCSSSFAIFLPCAMWKKRDAERFGQCGFACLNPLNSLRRELG
jgi:hypothetical protein